MSFYSENENKPWESAVILFGRKRRKKFLNKRECLLILINLSDGAYSGTLKRHVELKLNIAVLLVTLKRKDPKLDYPLERTMLLLIFQLLKDQ